MLRSTSQRARDIAQQDAKRLGRSAASVAATGADELAGINVGFNDNERRCGSGSDDWVPVSLTEWTYVDAPFYTAGD